MLMIDLIAACIGPGPNPTGTSAAADGSADSAADMAPDSADPAACGSPNSPQRYCSSCAAWLEMYPDSISGPATLGLADGTTASTLCQMARAGGGWTLIGTNAWGGAWTAGAAVDRTAFGVPSLAADFKSVLASKLPFSDLMFENDLMYAAYAGVDDGTRAYIDFSASVPLYNCGIDTEWTWPMTEGNFADKLLCEPSLYIHAADWEGGELPCADAEWMVGPVWSTWNKNRGCPLNDPRSASFIEDKWDMNPWGDHDPDVVNLPLRMWAR